MKKQNIISVILTVAVASAAIIGGAYALNQMREDENITAEETVKRFFDNWVEYEGNPLADRYYAESPFVSKKYSDKVDGIIASFDKGAYDPILCAQDFPETIEIVNTATKEGSAVVTIEKIFSGSSMMSEVVLEEQNGKWLINDIICKEGENNGEDLNSGVSPAIQDQVGDYIRENISELSPEKAVLGGKFYVTSIRFTSPYTCIVDYEDGHIALSAEVKFNIPGAGNVEIASFEIIENESSREIDSSVKADDLPVTNFAECLAAGNEKMEPDCIDCKAYCETENGERFEEEAAESADSFCEDLCGDGVCQEIVCMAEGCPCTESPNSCPEDCK